MKRFALVLLLIAAAAANAEDTRYTVPLADSPSIGPADAKVTIIEFLDFQ